MTKILLVEDDKSLREIYGVRLRAEGYDIVSAGDGEEALAMAIKERPDLIVSDVMMPKISGFDMLDILRSTTETKDIKVIMMTALSSEDQRQRGEKLGADRYLVKSQVGIEDVVRTVHEVLGDLPGSQQQPSSTAPASSDSSSSQTAQSFSSPVQFQASGYPAQQHPSQPMPAPQTADTPTEPLPSVSASLPQPTAPFSSSAPRPNSLGDRVLQPAPAPVGGVSDLEEMMQRELSEATNALPNQGAQTDAQPMSAVNPTPVDTGLQPANHDAQPFVAQSVVASSAPQPATPQIDQPPQPAPDAQSFQAEQATEPAEQLGQPSATDDPSRPDIASLSPNPPHQSSVLDL